MQSEKNKARGQKKISYEKVSDQIHVTVTPTFLEESSNVVAGFYLWAYEIRIENLGKEAVQLHSRYWHIMDGRGAVREIEGRGVVGEEPIIEPGGIYEYTSSVPLAAPSGFMRGHFKMVREPGSDRFLVEIPAFSLDSPFAPQILQ